MLCLFSYWSKTRTILYTIYDLFIHVIYQDYMPLITKLFTNINTECKNVKQFYDWLLDNLWYNIIKYIYFLCTKFVYIYAYSWYIVSSLVYTGCSRKIAVFLQFNATYHLSACIKATHPRKRSECASTPICWPLSDQPIIVSAGEEEVSKFLKKKWYFRNILYVVFQNSWYD